MKASPASPRRPNERVVSKISTPCHPDSLQPTPVQRRRFRPPTVPAWSVSRVESLRGVFRAGLWFSLEVFLPIFRQGSAFNGIGDAAFEGGIELGARAVNHDGVLRAFGA